ncbi:hypothetical protein KY386_02125 [Candidatus Parcubacteria bacterium]|nr:hypothetical protein [Candidatus Parcubacteria bacterium]
MFLKLPQKVILAGVAIAALLLGGAELRAAGGRDCDANAVVYCGALSQAELQEKMRAGDGRRSGAELQGLIYNGGWGITQAGIASRDTVIGSVRKDGTVWVGGEMVATGALSSGRQFMPGSYKQGDLWVRPPSVSFRSSELPAFVHMPDGRFRWAIIQSCGNPVRAQPVTRVVEKPVTRVVEKPVTRVVEKPVTRVVEKPVAVVQRPVVVQAPPVQPLPETGVGEALGMAAGTNAVYWTARHFRRSRASLKNALRQHR